MKEAISGYILHRISDGERAVTSSIVKDEILIWLSRYKASGLNRFLSALKLMPTLEILTYSPR